MSKVSFDNDKYLQLQSERIMERINKFDNKLYLEFGGKIFDDYHASRVLIGFEIDSKVRMLQQMKDNVEVVIAINANDIQCSKSRGDLGITYEEEVLRLIDSFENMDLTAKRVVITQYRNEPLADAFKIRLENIGIKVYIHYPIENYPLNVDLALSDDGFGKNDYIETTHSLIVVTGPGPGSGKMATCLSQLYNENKRGIRAGYAKYETFPIWNLPLKHPVNLAYEAATADLNDVNMIDYFHLESYGVSSVNYNRDLEVFPILKTMFERIYGESPYKSPTDMGVNMAGFGIVDDDAAIESSKQEIIRRYLDAKVANKLGKLKNSAVEKIDLIMKQLNITVEDRGCVAPALEKAEKSSIDAVALELPSGVIITGKGSTLFTSSSAVIINAIKHLAKIDDELMLLSPNILDPIKKLKRYKLNNNKAQRLNLEEVLIALAITATTNPLSQKALDQLSKLAGSEAHSTVLYHPNDASLLKKLKINITCESVFMGKNIN